MKLNPKYAKVMLQYLIILLDDKSTSYCHCINGKSVGRLIPLRTLKAGIRFGMMENLMIQFVYPNDELPQEYKDVVESIDHSKIVPATCEDKVLIGEADVIVLNAWEDIQKIGFDLEKSYVLRTDKKELFGRYKQLKDLLSSVARLNVVITDVDTFTDEDFEKYKEVLAALSEEVEKIFVDGKSPQLNLLTDRLMLKDMNNCGAGDSNITLAPNGKFYICPAFYYEEETDSVGDLNAGLDIKNKQLFRLDHAPICSHCDAWQCKRCVWLNRKTTLEVNTPSREQCVMAHLERNTSRELLANIRKHGTFLPGTEIKEIDYIDPFEGRDKW